MIRKILLVVCTTFVFINNVYANSVIEDKAGQLKSFTSIYTLKGGSLTIGESTRTLTINNEGTHIFESVTKPVGLGRLFTSGGVIERSEWLYHNGKPRPVRYTYLDSSRKDERKVQLNFDWTNNRVTNTINGDPWKMDLVPDTQDKLIYQVRVMIDLSAGKDSINYPVADGGQLKEYEFEILAPETTKTKLGKFETIPVKRTSGKRVTTLWCAKELNYLPVRIEQRNGEKTPITATLTSVQGLP